MLEGWAYTDQAQAQQGVGGRIYSVQPSPFVQRFRLNEAVFDRGDVAALQTLKKQFGVRWIVAVHGTGRPPTLPTNVAPVRFDNGAVTIYRVTN